MRTIGLSLLMGTAALLTVLQLVYLPSGDGTGTAEDLIWNLDSLSPATNLELPTATETPPETPPDIRLNKYGWGVANFARPAFSALAYSHLHIAIEDFDKNLQVALVWESSEAPEEKRKYSLENQSRESIWLATAELRGWAGNIRNLQLIIVGEPNTSIRIVDFSLSPPKALSQLRALYSDLAGFVPWNRSSMNSHSGATKVSSFYPTLLFTGLLVLCWAAYALLVMILRSTTFQWHAVGAIFLAVWILLDVFWQKRLTDQLSATREAFAGKSSEQKLAVGPDAQLYNFIRSAAPHIEHVNSRVFVASSDDYTGLRAAYYLYPHNAFWTLHGEEVPKNYYLRGGDYIVLMHPYKVEYDGAGGLIHAPRGPLQVDTLFKNRAGKLVRIR